MQARPKITMVVRVERRCSGERLLLSELIRLLAASK